MESKRGEIEWENVLKFILALVALFVIIALIYLIRGQGAGLIDKFFNLF